jgi:hypothetical protein
MGVLSSTEFDGEGRLARLGTNQIGRYAVHFHHDFGPKQTPSNGHQFTVIGNAVDSAQKWGITVHHSHYGLIQDNVVYNSRGAGIVTEDGTESFNVFRSQFLDALGRVRWIGDEQRLWASGRSRRRGCRLLVPRAQ